MLGNWVRQTTTTTGTGDLTVSSVSGYNTFDTVFGTTQYFRYAILDDSTGQPIESGIGHMSASTTLVRDFVMAKLVSGTYSEPNSTSGQATLAAGTKRVICTADATQMALNYDLSPARLNTTSNNRIILPDNLFSTAASALSVNNANRLYAWPVYIASRGPFDAFAIRISATGSANVDFALYRMNYDGSPGALVASNVALAVAGGMNYATFTATSITPGWYVMAIGASTASMTCYYGQPAGPSYGRSDSATALPFFRVNYTAGTLPDPFGAATSVGDSLSPGNAVPLIGLRLA